MHRCTVFVFVSLVHCAFSRDFYMGIFRENDYLVASDTLYKEKRPFENQVVKYGRLFKCPITYFRVTDRLNVGPGPRIQIIRGGLRRKFIVAKVTGGSNLPIAINVYVGCENTHKTKWTTKKGTTSPLPPSRTTNTPDNNMTTTESSNATSSNQNTDSNTSATKSTTTSQTINTTTDNTINTTTINETTTTNETA